MACHAGCRLGPSVPPGLANRFAGDSEDGVVIETVFQGGHACSCHQRHGRASLVPAEAAWIGRPGHRALLRSLAGVPDL